jgi:hypothetical protein
VALCTTTRFSIFPQKRKAERRVAWRFARQRAVLLSKNKQQALNMVHDVEGLLPVMQYNFI